MSPGPKYRRQRRLVDYAIFALLVVIVVHLGVVLVWALDRSPPLETAEGRAVTASVYPGELLIIEWTLTFRRGCPGRSHRRLRDGYFVDIPDMELTGRIPPERIGKPWVVRQSIQVPPSLHAGAWFFEARPVYVCNPLHRLIPIEVDLPPVPFVVLPNIDDAA